MNIAIIDLVLELQKKCQLKEEKIKKELMLSDSEYQFFLSLSACKDINSNELGKVMDLSLSRVSRVVDKLVIGGYLNRNTDTTDRRAIKLCLTPKGQEIRELILNCRKECEQNLLSKIPDNEIDGIKKNLEKLIKYMNDK